MNIQIREIVLDRFIGSRPDSRVPVERMRTARSIEDELEQATRSGEAAVLVRFEECPGGQVRDSFRVYRALRRFSEEGGQVVAHVSGWASSTAVALVAAADRVFMAPDAAIVVHSCYGGSAESVTRANDELAQVVLERTRVPADDLRYWLTLGDDRPAPNFAEISPAAALACGWAHEVGDVEAARSYASSLALAPELVGAKLDHQGTALKCAPGNLQIGGKILSDAWITSTVVVSGLVTSNGGVYVVSLEGDSTGVSASRIAMGGGYGLRVNLGSRLPTGEGFNVMLSPVANATYLHVQPVLFAMNAAGYATFDIAFRGTSSGAYNDPASSSLAAMFAVHVYNADGTWAVNP